MLVDPDFLLRVHKTPNTASAPAKTKTIASATPSNAYKLSDIELASRLSFFLWSSIPDNELLTLAEQNKLERLRQHSRSKCSA